MQAKDRLWEGGYAMSLKERVINIAPDFIVKFCAAPYVAGDNKEAAIKEAVFLRIISK